jgi:hypothetical protein
MIARMLKNSVIKELWDKVDQNIDAYRTGDFKNIKADPNNSIEADVEIDEAKLASIVCTEKDRNEIQNCKLMKEAMDSITPYLARDQRIWVYLTHTHLLNYSRNRWPIPSEKEQAVIHIKDHFFVSGARGFERDNAVARLWWMAYVCSRVVSLSLEDSLACLLYQSDVRANIIERPTTTQNPLVFSYLMEQLFESYKTDKMMFERDKFREIMKKLNLQGGIKLLGALDKDNLRNILQPLI